MCDSNSCQQIDFLNKKGTRVVKGGRLDYPTSPMMQLDNVDLQAFKLLDPDNQSIVKKWIHKKTHTNNFIKSFDTSRRQKFGKGFNKHIEQAIKFLLVEDEISDKDLAKIIQNISENKAVNVDELLTDGNKSLLDVFYNETNIKAFKALANVGVGGKQKGKGEFALALMSHDIEMATGAGDIVIKDIKCELKLDGGRLTETNGPKPNTMTKIIVNILKDQSQHVLPPVTQKTLNLKDFITRLNAVNVCHETRTDLIKALYGEIFYGNTECVDQMLRVFQQHPINYQTVLNQFAITSFDWYKSEASGKWDKVIGISLETNNVGVASSSQKFSQLNKKLVAPAIISSTDQARETYFQFYPLPQQHINYDKL